MRILGVLSMMCALAAVPATAEDSMPPDPVAPINDQVCLDLHARYRTLIDHLSEQTDTCHAERPAYVQGRYGHDFGEGECARHVVEKCRAYVDRCTVLAQAAMPALKRCRAALPN